MKKLLFLALAVPFLTAAAGERYLLKPEGRYGEVEFEAPYFSTKPAGFRVVDDSGKSVPQRAIEDYARFKRIRFEVPQKNAGLYLETGKADGKALSENAGELWRFSDLKWSSSIPQLARTAKGFSFVAPSHVSRPYIESVPVALPAGRDDAVIFEYKGVSRSMHPWVMRIQILQFDKNGKVLPCGAVDERWLNFHTAPGKTQHIRQAGRLDRRAVKVAARVYLHQFKTKKAADDGYPPPANAVLYPAVDILTFSLRSGKKCHLGGLNRTIFTGNGLKLDGRSGTAFNPAGAELWSEGKYITDAREFAFPLETGSVEIDFTPDGNLKKYTLFDTHMASDRQRKRALELVVDPQKNTVVFVFPGTERFVVPAVVHAGKRHRITLDWSGADARCFVDGKEKACVKLSGVQHFSLDVKNNRHIPATVGVGMSAQAVYISANRPDDAAQFMKGTLHAARFSTIRRGSCNAPLVCDKDTAAFFDYSRSIDAVTGFGRGFVYGTWYGREPLEKAIPYVISQPQLAYPSHDVYNDIPSADDFAVSRVKCEKRFTMKPDETYKIDCKSTPRMEYIEIACPSDEKEITDPLVRKPDDIDPRSFASIRRDLKLNGSSDAEKASRIFGYLLKITDYFIQHPVSYPQPYRSDMSDYTPLAMINNYIGEDCGPQNFTTLTLFNTLAGFPSTLTAGNGHSFQQVFFDGSWQVWDLSAEQFMRSRDPRRGASLEELERDPYLFRLSNYFAHPAGFIRMGKRHNGFFPDVEREIIGYKLRNGEKFRIHWYNDLVCNNLQCAPHLVLQEGMISHTKLLNVAWQVNEAKWRVPPEFSTGVFICENTPAEKPALFKCAHDHFTYEFTSSHPMTSVAVETEPRSEVEYSFDGGRKYVKDPSVFVKGRRQIIIKVKAKPADIKKYSSRIGVQLNTRTLTGKLSRGSNQLSLDIRKGSKADVKVVWSVDAAPLTVDGAFSFGVAKGWEKHLIVLDPAAKFAGKICGATSEVKLAVSAGITAEIKAGKLLVAAKENVNNSLETLEITDGSRKKSFAVLVSRNSRLHCAAKAETSNGAEVKDGLVKFTAPGQQAVFRQDKLPKGKYCPLVLFNMFFPPEKEVNDMRMLTLSGMGEDFEVVGRIRNLGTDFFIVRFSKPRFKWDFPQYGKYPYARIKVYDRRPAKKLVLKSMPQVRGGNGVICDVAALLILDASNDDFVIEVAKYLTTFNGFPERFR